MKRLFLAAVLVAGFSPAMAQVTPSWPVGGLASQRAPGYVELCVNSAGQAVPVAMCDQAPNVTGPNRVATPEQRANVVALSPNSGATNPFPSNATPTTAVGVGTTGAVTATMAATPGKTNWVCSVQVSAIGGTATVGPITVTGLKGGNTLTYQVASTAAGNFLIIPFQPCFPASAANTAIAAATTADGTATAVDVNIIGYLQ
jgi:hypothetical protein